MTVIDGRTRPVVEVEGNFMRGVAVQATGVQESELWEIRMAPGAATPPHTHDAEEVVYVLDGRLTGIVGGVEQEVDAGEALLVPAGVLHQLFNRGDAELHKVAVLGRAGAQTFLPDGSPFETTWQL